MQLDAVADQDSLDAATYYLANFPCMTMKNEKKSGWGGRPCAHAKSANEIHCCLKAILQNHLPLQTRKNYYFAISSQMYDISCDIFYMSWKIFIQISALLFKAEIIAT